MDINQQHLELEQQKLKLEQQRFQLEQERAQHQGRFLDRHLAGVLAASVSFAAVIVSLCQVWVGCENQQSQIKVAQIQKEKEIILDSIENERRWQLDAAEFVFTNKEKIFSGTSEERQQMRDVMIATLPLNITKTLFKKIIANSSDSIKGEWLEQTKRVYTEFWSGTWNTTIIGEHIYNGSMKIEISAEGLSGEYYSTSEKNQPNNGSFKGSWDSDYTVVRGTWKNSKQQSGSCIFRLSNDGNSFEGYYSMRESDKTPENHQSNRWIGIKTSR